jgi:phosphate transport system permease protein
LILVWLVFFMALEAMPALFVRLGGLGTSTPISSRWNLISLGWGSVKVVMIALTVAIPIAIPAALYVSQVAPVRWRVWLKPTLELMQGVPTVVLAFLALWVLAPALQRAFGAPFLLNGMVAGVAVGLAIVPVMFSLVEDALSAVPREWFRSALALGATPWEAVRRVVWPAAASGIGAAVLLGMSQALGETMIVMMVSGNATLPGWSLWDPVRTVPVELALEWVGTARGSQRYSELFLMGFVLLGLSVALQGLARMIRIRNARQRGEVAS